MSDSALGDRFRRVCRERQNAVAVRALGDEEALTFADMAEASARMQRAFVDAGIHRGATVVVRLGNRPAWFPLLVACMESGLALVPLGDATDAEAVACIHQARATAVITDRTLALAASRTGSLAPDIALLKLDDPDDSVDYGESVVLKLTSGSTDMPKAAVTSERQLINDGRHVVEAMGLRPDDTNLACIPLSHSYALGNVVIPCLWQGTAVVLRQSFNPLQFVQDVGTTGATVFPGVPFMFDRLKSAGIDRLPASLRLLITAGAPIDIETVVWFRTRLDRKVHSFYGSSETGGIAYDDSEVVADPLHVGRPLPNTTITIGDGDPDADRPAGRIFVRGDAVASRYAIEESGDAPAGFVDGGFLTSDIGRWTDDGYLVLMGRVSMLVNVAGRKVDPAEVERTLRQVPGVADARVFGISCDRRGQEVVAFVVRDDGALTPLAIRRRLAATMSAHKIPRRFVFVDSFPVDARGKIDRLALQALAADAREA